MKCCLGFVRKITAFSSTLWDHKGVIAFKNLKASKGSKSIFEMCYFRVEEQLNIENFPILFSMLELDWYIRMEF